MQRPALLIIDMQNDFVLEGRPLRVAAARSLVPNIREILDAFRAKHLPVFHIMRVHRKDGSDVEMHRRDLFAKQPFPVEGTKGAAVIDELAPRGGEYLIPKIRMCAFIGTELDLMLRSLRCTDVVICGIQTPNCIRTTTFDATAYNYPVVLAVDANGAQTEEIYEANVYDMQNIGVRILTTRDLIATI